jgi:hypothetical protein
LSYWPNLLRKPRITVNQDDIHLQEHQVTEQNSVLSTIGQDQKSSRRGWPPRGNVNRPLPSIADMVNRVRQTFHYSCSGANGYMSSSFPADDGLGRKASSKPGLLKIGSLDIPRHTRSHILLQRPLRWCAMVISNAGPGVRLETAKGCHEVFDLAARRGSSGFEAVLDT